MNNTAGVQHKSKEEGKPASLSMAIAEKSALHACYMPFIKDGGVFVPTTEKFTLHDEVILHLRLVEDGKKLLIPGRVVWISPGVGHRGTSPGVGLQFTGEQRLRVKQFIEEILGDLAKQPAANPSY
ncbi:PilZ domain-containing protein [Candidatus Thiothrix sp. Deng01]|uniref:PilZ domain-containing protein n=2 Tax=Thiothrix TaxID=1030 RepID=A0A7L6AQT1_9GAMM|nr:PilZ domain-containing protein [Candidatus Thiothrix sp. Deng01]MEB4590355.1 PilZ domain-containing protein [Candidatus Thiothrix sp. Deng01]QLQ31357.1 MAG: PilZ domain-containing protein [Candidatus Thiothrix singaporensis]